MPRTTRVTGCIAGGSNDLDCGLLHSNSMSLRLCRENLGSWIVIDGDRLVSRLRHVS